MDCSKDEHIQMTDEGNVLQPLIDTEFQENIVITADNNTTSELFDSRSVELEEENTNIESCVDRECTDRECINILDFLKNWVQPLDQKSSTTCVQNFNNVNESENIFHESIHINATDNDAAEPSLVTDNSENIINVDVNLFKGIKPSEDSDIQDKLTSNTFIQMNHYLDQKSPTTTCVQNFNNVKDSENIFLKGIHNNAVENSLATDNSENSINVAVNLLKDIKPSEDYDMQDKFTPKAHNIYSQMNYFLDKKYPTTPCVKNFNNVKESENIFNEGIHNNAASLLATDIRENSISVDISLFKDIKPSEYSNMQDKITPKAHNIYSQMNPNDFETRSIRKLEKVEQVDETNLGQRNEACCKMQEVSPFPHMTVVSEQTLLIQPQDIANRKRSEQISDSSVESMSTIGYCPDNRKKEISTIFDENEQIFKDKMSRRHKEICESEWIENLPTEIKSKRLKINNTYTPPSFLASSLLISPLTSIEPITDLQFETDSINDVSDVQNISNSEPLDENILVNYTETSVCSQSMSDINAFSPKANQCFTGNEAETDNSEAPASEVEDKSSKAYMENEIVLNNEQLLNGNTKGISEHNIIVTSISQGYELDSNSKVTEEGRDPYVEKNEKSSYRCPVDSLDCSSDSVTTIITDITRDSEEMPNNEKIKTTECIIMEGICSCSTKSPQEMHLLKSQNLDNEKNQQVSDSCDELMDVTENSKAAQKRKFSENFLENEQQFYNAKMLRSFKIKNKGNSSKQFQEATNFTSKIKSLQICRKQALVKPSKNNLLMNPSQSFESGEVFQLESDERNLERDKYHKQTESNTNLKSTTPINSKNILIKHTENCVNVPKNILDGAVNCLQEILSYIENETNEGKMAAINLNSMLGHTSMTVPITTKSQCQEVLTNTSNNTFDTTKIQKIENAPCSADTGDITTENGDVAEHPEVKMNDISSNEALEEMFPSGSKNICEESTLSKETNTMIQDTSLNNISGTGSSHTLIKLYLENIEHREFTVENVANFIREHDPYSISYFSALHATRIFLKKALKNGMVKMVNGYYRLLPTESSTKHKSTLKFQLKKMINRQHSDIQTITSLKNNNLEDNKAAEQTIEDTATTNIIGRIAETNSHDTTPTLEDRHGSENVHSHENYLQK